MSEHQHLLEEANRLFPGRYEMAYVEGHPRPWQIRDLDKNRTVAVAAAPEEAAKKAVSSARISANNGQRRYAHGHAPVARSITLTPAEWAALDELASREGMTMTAWLRSKI